MRLACVLSLCVVGACFGGGGGNPPFEGPDAKDVEGHGDAGSTVAPDDAECANIELLTSFSECVAMTQDAVACNRQPEDVPPIGEDSCSELVLVDPDVLCTVLAENGY